MKIPLPITVLIALTTLCAASTGFAASPDSTHATQTASTDDNATPMATARTQSDAKAQVLDRIVAVVNDGVILQSELLDKIGLVQTQMRQRSIQPPSAAALQSQVLDHMIDTKIQLQRAEQDGIKVGDTDLNDAMKTVARQNQMTVSEFMQSAQKEGISSADLRHQIRNEIIIQKLRQKEIMQRIDVTDQDVDLFLANHANNDNVEYRLSHILISVPDNADKKTRAKAQAKAQAILAKLHKGANFAQVAIADSDGQQALQGGDLGWRKGSDLPTMFASAVPTMKVGQVSDVIPALNGYNIIKLVNQRSSEKRQKMSETHMRHILLKANALRDGNATHALVQKLYRELQNGADFTKLAKKYSDDLQTKANGGDLGWRPSGLFPAAFQTRLNAVKAGGIMPPFDSPQGWELTQVLGRRTVDVTDKMRRARAKMAIMRQRADANYQSWLRRLRSQAYVDIRLKPGMVAQADVTPRE